MKRLFSNALPGLTKPINPNSRIKIEIDEKVVIDSETKMVIDYFVRTLTDNHHKAMLKRNVTSQSLSMAYRLLLIIFVVKFHPEIFYIIIRLKDFILNLN